VTAAHRAVFVEQSFLHRAAAGDERGLSRAPAVASGTRRYHAASYNHESSALDAGPWFYTLSQPLREAIVGRSVVRRLRNGAVRVQPTPLVVLSRDELPAIAHR
jgi:hypothetical protein